MSFVVTAASTATVAALGGGALGVGAAATAGSLGAAAGGALAGAATASALGSGVGALSAAVQGQDVGEGALMGAVSGVATAGVGAGLGAVAAPAVTGLGQVAQGAAIGGAAGAAGGAAGAAAGGKDVGMGALVGGAGGAVSGGAFKALSPAPGAAPEASMLDGAAKVVSTPSAPITGGEIGIGLKSAGLGAATQYAGNSMVDSAKLAKEDAARGEAAVANSSGLGALQAAGLPVGKGPLGQLGSIGMATGGITALAQGGQIPVKEGAYIIPADVVSALGNGSSKAGAEYLQRLMIEVRKEAVNIQGIGAAKNHVQ
tara:strand:+ start:204 stop:1148 length:945 start_codon:yes stop_codon:yes gene_type:complete